MTVNYSQAVIATFPYQTYPQQYPVVQVDIQFMGIDQLTLALKNFELDVGITDLDQLTDSRLDTLPLYDEPLYLLLPNNDWLNDELTVNWSEAAELPLCLLSPPMRERQMIDAAFATAKCEPAPQLESNSIFQLAFHVMSGDLATIVPKRFNELPGTRAKQLINPTITQKLGLVWVSGNPILPMARALIELMTQALADDLFD